MKIVQIVSISRKTWPPGGGAYLPYMSYILRTKCTCIIGITACVLCIDGEWTGLNYMYTCTTTCIVYTHILCFNPLPHKIFLKI